MHLPGFEPSTLSMDARLNRLSHHGSHLKKKLCSLSKLHVIMLQSSQTSFNVEGLNTKNVLVLCKVPFM